MTVVLIQLKEVMKMKLTFFKQAATPNRVDKTGYLTEMGSIDNVVIKEPRNMTHPTFILATNPLVYNSNYLFCSFTSRYYYIDSVDVLTGGRIAINCSIDVLYTYRNEILGSSAWVERSEKTTDDSDDYDMLHNDYPFRQDYKILGRQSDDSIFYPTAYSDTGINMVLIMK